MGGLAASGALGSKAREASYYQMFGYNDGIRSMFERSRGKGGQAYMNHFNPFGSPMELFGARYAASKQILPHLKQTAQDIAGLVAHGHRPPEFNKGVDRASNLFNGGESHNLAQGLDEEAQTARQEDEAQQQEGQTEEQQK
jgi:hypothetical protein